MIEQPWIFRVYAPSGRYRVEVPSNASLNQLHRLVAEACELGSPSGFRLLSDCGNPAKRVRHSSSTLISHPSSKLENGQILYVKIQEPSTLTGSASVLDDDEDVASGAPSSDRRTGLINGSESGQNDTRSWAHSVPDGSKSLEARDGDGTTSSEGTNIAPKFKAFDQFLKERGYNVNDLPLLMDFKPRQLVKGVPNSIPPAVTLKHQPYRHVDHVEFLNVKEVNRFGHYWRHELDMCEQRAGWLFGYFEEDAHYPEGIRAVVEAIYEPPQLSESGSIMLLDDPRQGLVKRLAAALGLERVGFIFTHFPRDELLSPEEVIRSARIQLEAAADAPKHYTGYPVAPCVTVTVSVNAGDGSMVTNAFSISDLGMAFVRDQFLEVDATQHPSRLRLAKQKPHELMPQVLESGTAVDTIDPDWFLVRVNDSAPKKVCGLTLKSSSFPVENRKTTVTLADIAKHLPLSAGQEEQVQTQLADFHFLLYIAELFDERTAISLCDAVRKNEAPNSSFTETLRLLLQQ